LSRCRKWKAVKWVCYLVLKRKSKHSLSEKSPAYAGLFLCFKIPRIVHSLNNFPGLLAGKHRQLNPEKSKANLIHQTGLAQFKIQSAIALTNHMRWHVIEPAFEVHFDRIIARIQKTILYGMSF